MFNNQFLPVQTSPQEQPATGFTPTRLGTITILQLYFVEVKQGYQPMTKRCYMVNNLNHQTMEQLENFCQKERYETGRISPIGIANNLAGIVGLRGNTQDQRTIMMPNGWNTSRFRVILVVEVRAGPIFTKYFIQGYTDYLGASQTDTLDPNMTIYINSVSEIKTSYNAKKKTYDMYMGETYSTLTDFCRKVDQNPWETDQALIRPIDIMKLNFAQESNHENNDEYYTHHTQMYGFGEYPAEATETTIRKNLDPSIYLTRMMNAYIDGQHLSSTSYDTSFDADIYASAVRELPEPEFLNNSFVMRLREVTNNYSPSSLTLQNLFQLDYTLEHDQTGRVMVLRNDGETSYEKISSDMRDLTAPVEYTSSTIQVTDRNLRILELNNMITGHLLNCGLTKATLIISCLIPGHPHVSVTEANSLLGQEIVNSAVENFKRSLTTLVIPYFSRGYTTTSEIMIQADVLKDTTIVITEYDGYGATGDREIFRFPTFADALWNPMISTTNERAVLNKDLNDIFANALTTH